MNQEQLEVKKAIKSLLKQYRSQCDHYNNLYMNNDPKADEAFYRMQELCAVIGDLEELLGESG
jgi:hypothetical protein